MDHRGQRAPLRTASPANRSRPASPRERLQSGSRAATPVHAAVGAMGFGMGAQEVTANIHVVCRVRPMSEHEKRSGTVPCVTASTDRSEVQVVRSQPGSATRQVKSTFNFDSVLTSFSTQTDVFYVTLKPLIKEVLAGYEAAAFAYGQTGTGKTYTMEGNLDSEDGMGLIPRASAGLFQALAIGNFVSSSVSASCMELYNEELTDLLLESSQQQQKLDLKETGHGVACFGLSEVPVSSAEAVQDLICLAQDRKKIAETRINARSSRSHTIFTFHVCCRKRVEGGEMDSVGKLHLVDLAGSECAKKASMNEVARTGTIGGGSSLEAERERRNINQSLLTLGRVIAALRSDSTGVIPGIRVPYRDSKLTRLLQVALGGSCRTVMIATISPAQAAVDETVSTLAYAEQAMGIQNRPIAATTMVMRAPSGELNGNLPALPGDMMDGGETQMRLAYLTQEVEECKQALSRKICEAQDLGREVEEAEVKYASAASELEEQRLVTAERDFALKATVAFADGRVESAKCLASVVEESQERGRILEERLRKSSTVAAEVRQQARSLHTAATERLDSLATSGGVACAEGVVAAVEIAGKTWREPLHELRAVASAQQGLLDGLVNEARNSGDLLSEVLATACVKFSESAAIEKQENSERLAGIEASASTGSSAARSGALVAKAKADRCEVVLAEQIESLNATALSKTRSLADAAAHASGDLEAARISAAALQETSDDVLAKTICKRVVDLRDELCGLGAETRQHVESLVGARGRVAEDCVDAAARRGSISEAILRLGETHTSAVAATSSPISNALRMLAEALAARHEQVADGLAFNASKLTDVHQCMAEAATTGETTIQAALRSGGDHLVGAWAEIDSGFTSLNSLLQGDDDMEIGTPGDDSIATQEAASAHPVALSDILIAAASALDKAREETAREVAELRKQRQNEEQLISTLSRQRSALQVDVAQMQASLADVTSELETARTTLEGAEVDQARRREEALQAVMSGVESLLRGGMDGIGRGLKDHSDTIRSHIGQASACASASSGLVASAEKQAVATGDEACQVAKSWAAASDAACDRIVTAQEASLQASRQVHTAATENISSLVTVVGRLQAAQDAVQPKWASSRDSAAAAVASWCQHEKAAVQTLSEVASKNAFVLQQAAALHQDVLEHCTGAEAKVTERAVEDQRHTALLTGLDKLHSEYAQKEDATDAHHLGVLSALGEGALTIAESAAQCSPKADAVAEAIRGQALEARSAAEAHDASLASVRNAVAELAPQAEASNSCLREHVAQLQASVVDSSRQAAKSAADVADEVVTALGSAKSEVDAQRVAFDVADAAEAERWLELERKHGDVLKAAGVVASKADLEGSALRVRAEAKSEEERADAAQQRVVAELEEHRLQLTSALTEHQRLLRDSLSDTPMLAFAEDIFEDDLPAEVAPVPSHVVQELAVVRPSEQALSAEFHGTCSNNGEIRAGGIPKEDSIPMRAPSPSPRFVRKNSVDEDSGYPRVPRLALRELQVGGTPMS